MKNKRSDADWTFKYGRIMHKVAGLWWHGDITTEQWSKYRDMLQDCFMNRFYPKNK
jgi:hypothetical protein